MDDGRSQLHLALAVGSLYKFKILSETRREEKIATTHITDMLGVIFYEQRSIATGFGFIEVPCIENGHSKAPCMCDTEHK